MTPRASVATATWTPSRTATTSPEWPDEVHFRNRYECDDGSYRWFSWTAATTVLDGAVCAVARDGDGDDHTEVLERASRLQAVLSGPVPQVVLQPIFALQTGMVQGFEALTRGSADIERPRQVWFGDSAPGRIDPDMEIRVVTHAAALAEHLPPAVYLSVNVSPATLACPELEAAVAPLAGDQLVLEISEAAADAGDALVTRALGRLRRRGVRLAIDDAGAGYSGLMQILQLAPEFIKLDRFVTRGIDRDPAKRALAAALVRFAADVGACLVAEGVDSAEELSTLEELGVDYAQGFVLGRSLPLPRRGATTISPVLPSDWLSSALRVVESD